NCAYAPTPSRECSPPTPPTPPCCVPWAPAASGRCWSPWTATTSSVPSRCAPSRRTARSPSPRTRPRCVRWPWRRTRSGAAWAGCCCAPWSSGRRGRARRTWCCPPSRSWSPRGGCTSRRGSSGCRNATGARSRGCPCSPTGCGWTPRGGTEPPAPRPRRAVRTRRPPHGSPRRHGELVEQGAVLPQRHAQPLGVAAALAAPLPARLDAPPAFVEAGGELFDGFADETVGGGDTGTRVVDEVALDPAPAGLEPVRAGGLVGLLRGAWPRRGEAPVGPAAGLCGVLGGVRRGRVGVGADVTGFVDVVFHGRRLLGAVVWRSLSCPGPQRRCRPVAAVGSRSALSRGAGTACRPEGCSPRAVWPSSSAKSAR